MSLYDPNEFPQEVPIQVTPVVEGEDFSLPSVLAWARTKPVAEGYDFVKAAHCALGQYAQERQGWSYSSASCGLYETFVPRAVMNAAHKGISGSGGLRTFGRFVQELEKLL